MNLKQMMTTRGMIADARGKKNAAVGSEISNDFTSVVKFFISHGADEVLLYKRGGNSYFYDFDENPVKILKASEGENGVVKVGSDFYGYDKLIVLSGEKLPNYPVFIRKNLSSGYGGAYRNQPIGQVEVQMGNSDYNMTLKEDRDRLAKVFNE